MAVMSVAGRRIVSFVALLLLICTTGVFSVPTPGGSSGASPTKPFGTCKKIYVRKEWRSLSYIERFQYFFAVNYILCKDGRTPASVYAGTKSRYDDLVATHINQTFNVHFVGHFLPFHRYYTWTFEKMLRDEAGYDGPFPYWDWHRDFGTGPDKKGYNTELWNGFLSFGGNGDYVPSSGNPGMDVPGRTGGGCVKNGAFQWMKVNLGPGASYAYNPRCLTRDFSPYFANRYLQANQTKLTLQAKNFYDFDRVVEGGPSFELSGVHGGGHYGVGGTLGTMGDLNISPGDPAFWLHHANLDRVWWSWQKLNYPARLTDFGGPSCIMDWYNPAVPGGGQKCPNATLSQTLNLQWADVVKPNVGVTVKDVMNIADLCYDYDELLDPADL
ncbi:Tyrosinase [Dactylellina cionopaga]|nr:Tyrosinase [Dactylellina cionopaga]